MYWCIYWCDALFLSLFVRSISVDEMFSEEVSGRTKLIERPTRDEHAPNNPFCVYGSECRSNYVFMNFISLLISISFSTKHRTLVQADCRLCVPHAIRPKQNGKYIMHLLISFNTFLCGQRRAHRFYWIYLYSVFDWRQRWTKRARHTAIETKIFGWRHSVCQ